MECNKEKNLEKCNCSYPGCPRKGMCCECIEYHLDKNQLPACAFPDNVEETYNRSFEKFIEVYR
ncbi:MAG: DUF6485 family protein [Candidatus Natronoplasma sp.]